MSGRVLVTGAAGFIGSHICDAYLAAGWDVTGVDDLSRGKRTNLPAGMRFEVLDVRSPEARTLVAGGRFDVLNVQAAQIDVRVSVSDPGLDGAINLMGLVNLLMGAADGGVKRVVFASSGGVVYGDGVPVPTVETARKFPVSPYGVSKLGGEHYLRALGALYGFEGVALRYSNVFGPRQDPHGEAGVISIFAGRLQEGRGLTVFGDGRQTRDYVYVKDVARVNVLASSAALPPVVDHDDMAFNVATGLETDVLQLAGQLGRAMGVAPVIEHAAPRAGELQRSCLSIEKTGRTFGWQPEVSLAQGLDELVAWVKAGAA